MKILKCEQCSTWRIEEDTTGGTIRRLEQNTEITSSNVPPCEDCILWVEELIINGR